MVKYLLSLYAIVWFAFAGHAQQKFEGMLSFDITYVNMPEEQKQAQAYMPTNMYVLIKGAKQRMELKTLMGPMIAIVDAEKNESYTLTSMFGKKLAMYISPEQNRIMAEKLKQQNLASDKKVEFTTETKTVAGYKCRKILIHTVIEGTPLTLTAYYTNELPAIRNDIYNNGFDLNIEGCLLEYQFVLQGIEMIYTATAVEAKTLDTSLFEVPSDYQIVPYQMGN